MPTLADIYSAIDSAKRRGTDFIQNPGTSLAQMLGNANDRARAFNELNRQAADETIAARDPFANGPANQELLRTVAGAYNPVGMINQPIKGAKLVNIPIDMIEHGEAVMPGGTLTFAGARKKIEEYAKKETPIPPIDVVSGEAGKPWMVADGSHRLEAAKLRGEKTIPAYVSPHDKEGLEQIAKFKMNAKDAIPTQINPAESKARQAINDLVNQAKYFGVDSPIDHTKMSVGQVMSHLDDYLGRSQQVANLPKDAISSLRNLWYKAEDAANAYKRVYGEDKLMGTMPKEAANESTKRFKFDEKKIAKMLKKGEYTQEEFDKAIAYNRKYFPDEK